MSGTPSTSPRVRSTRATSGAVRPTSANASAASAGPPPRSIHGAPRQGHRGARRPGRPPSFAPAPDGGQRPPAVACRVRECLLHDAVDLGRGAGVEQAGLRRPGADRGAEGPPDTPPQFAPRRGEADLLEARRTEALGQVVGLEERILRQASRRGEPGAHLAAPASSRRGVERERESRERLADTVVEFTGEAPALVLLHGEEPVAGAPEERRVLAGWRRPAGGPPRRPGPGGRAGARGTRGGRPAPRSSQRSRIRPVAGASSFRAGRVTEPMPTGFDVLVYGGMVTSGPPGWRVSSIDAGWWAGASFVRYRWAPPSAPWGDAPRVPEPRAAEVCSQEEAPMRLRILAAVLGSITLLVGACSSRRAPAPAGGAGAGGAAPGGGGA